MANIPPGCEKPEDWIGLFVWAPRNVWQRKPAKTVFFVESYDAKYRMFRAYCYGDGFRYDIKLLDMNRFFCPLKPQPVMEGA